MDPKMSEMRQIDIKISKNGVCYCKNPTHDKKCGTCPQNPTAGPQTYWAPRAQVPQQFPALSGILINICRNGALGLVETPNN